MRRGIVVLLLGLVVGLIALPAQATAAPEFLWQAPESGPTGGEAGKLSNPEGIAADPKTGHVFVADYFNSRVDEFDAWGQFVRAWGWGVKDGANEFQACGPPTPEPNPQPSLCRSGISGAGQGQFKTLLGGIAADASGDLYIADMANHRISKFDPSAGPGEDQIEFLLSFGSLGNGPGQFETEKFGQYVSVGGSPEALFVGDAGRIQEFNLEGNFKRSIPLEGILAGKTVQSLAADSNGNLYLSFDGENIVTKLSSAGAALCNIDVQTPNALAVAENDSLYVSVNRKEVAQFASDCTPLIAPGSGFGKIEEGVVLQALTTNVVDANGESDIYFTGASAPEVGRSYVQSYGPPPDKWLPPKAAPDIKAQFAVTVDSGSASLRAQINPRYWGNTSYYVEVGTGKCSDKECATSPDPPGNQLGGGVVSRVLTSKDIVVASLQPHTLYHFRFCAQSSGSDGEVSCGVGGKVGVDGLEGTFVTASQSVDQQSGCPNDSFRSGLGSRLPDCRAYELVSPVDKNGSDIATLIQINSILAALDQSSAEGGRLTYTTSQGFGDAKGVPYVSQYLANRGANGWQSEGISPPQGVPVLGTNADALELQFRAFTENLCAATLFNATDLLLDPSSPPGFANLYRTQLCGGSGYQALNTTSPPTLGPKIFAPDLQGMSADGNCGVFRVKDKLTSNASNGAKVQVYESCGDEMKLISVLPNGQASAANSSLGTPGVTIIRTANVKNAVSANGDRIYWTAEGNQGFTGQLYLRVNPTEEQSPVVGGKCTEANLACTLKVSETVAKTGAFARFYAASQDGSRAIFAIEDPTSPLNGNLYEFDVEESEGEITSTTTLISRNLMGVMGTSDDASSVYFVSKEVFGGENSQGDSAQAKEPNLYLYTEENIVFIGTLSADDARTTASFAPTPVALEPFKRTSRVSPGGKHVVFMSSASLTGYDNVDANNGEKDAEVFLYSADEEASNGELACVSCNPTRVRPSGRELRVEERDTGVWAAAQIPGFTTQLYGSRVLTSGGNRVFFTSFEPLAPGDTNGRSDVYQWEASGTGGVGGCRESDISFDAASGGCVSLMSSGQAPTDSEFIDASADGTDLFFSTLSSLVPQDPGLIDIYDARVGGGFPAPPLPAVPCEGESCQSAPSAPQVETPASSTFVGPGTKCPQGKRQIKRGGRTKCVKRQAKHKPKPKGRPHAKKNGRVSQ